MNSDRDQILRRRALLIGSAMTAIACGPATQLVTQPTVIAAPAEAEGEPESAAKEAPIPDNPARLQDTAKPSMEVPAGIDEELRDLYEWLHSNTRVAEGHAEAIKQTLPTCTPGDTPCDDQWKAVAQRYYQLTQLGREAREPASPPSEDDGYNARAVEHRKYVRKLVELAYSELQQAIDVNGKYWLKLIDKIRQAHSRPCLSIL